MPDAPHIDTRTLIQIVDPVNRADPYPLYARLREAGPARLTHSPILVLSRFADCQQLLREPAGSVDRRKAAAFAGRYPTLDGWQVEDPSFLFRDPPDHTRLRRLVSTAFTARVVQGLEPRIRAMVDDLFDAAKGRERLDVVADLAYPLPVAVICQLLGVPLEDEPRFHEWSALLARSLDPVFAFSGAVDPHPAEQAEAGAQMRRYFAELIESRRSRPGQDLLSALIAVEESGDQLTESELISTCALLLVAGHETTVNLIANGALALARHPEWMARLASDPDLAGPVVEEVLRYDPPVQMMGRVATDRIEVAGATLEPGEFAVLLLAAAHRDPAATPEPDRFDPGRREVRHLAFGMGAHFCLGAPLARLEARLALTGLARRIPDPGLLCDPPPYRQNMNLRGPESLCLVRTTGQ